MVVVTALAEASPLPSVTITRLIAAPLRPPAAGGGYRVETSGTFPSLVIADAASLELPSIIARNDATVSSHNSKKKKVYIASLRPWPHLVNVLFKQVNAYPPVSVRVVLFC